MDPLSKCVLVHARQWCFPVKLRAVEMAIVSSVCFVVLAVLGLAWGIVHAVFHSGCAGTHSYQQGLWWLLFMDNLGEKIHFASLKPFQSLLVSGKMCPQSHHSLDSALWVQVSISGICYVWVSLFPFRGSGCKGLTSHSCVSALGLYAPSNLV